MYFAFKLVPIGPSLRKPNRVRMLATRSYSEKQTLQKEYTSRLSTINTKECKFKIGDHVIVPTRDKEMITSIVRWTGGVRLSQKTEEIHCCHNFFT